MAALLVERSFIDLRSHIKCLISDLVRAKVWDARTKELLRVFNIEGQIENRVDTPQSVQDQPVEDEMKVKFISTSKKEKSHGTSFLQRSRNAIMGVAGAFVEDNKRTEALVISADGMFWSGCTNGLLVQWDGNGNRLQDVTHHPYVVQCICTYGTRIYLAVGKGYIYSLATHGGIRGWSITSPGPLDNLLISELAAKEAMYSRRDNIRILIGTWNVGQGRASHDSLMSWLDSVSSVVGIIAMSAAKETDLKGVLEEGTTFERMGSRQLAGLLISLWLRKNLRTYIYKTMVFSRSANLLYSATAGVSSAVNMMKGANTAPSSDQKKQMEEMKPDLAEADMDQLRAEIKAGKVFQGMREALIRFPPTYKFERNLPGLAGYDSGEKRQIPAWCDRIIYHDSRTGTEPVSDCSLDCPV
ncbi:hypothetical protein QYF36_002537 [Acer negundo]|nr:hypothetical protein QYF36_002537 [Acer negundo]